MRDAKHTAVISHWYARSWTLNTNPKGGTPELVMYNCTLKLKEKLCKKVHIVREKNALGYRISERVVNLVLGEIPGEEKKPKRRGEKGKKHRTQLF